MSTSSADDGSLAGLLADLERASFAAGGIGGGAPLGVRAVEDRPRQRAYLCAFEGPRFLCLTADLEPEGQRDTAIEVASAALLVEHTEGVLDDGALIALAESAGGVLAALGGQDDVEAAVGEIAERALALERWVADPARALASVPALDAAVALHDAVVVAWARFVRVSEPLAAAQERLSAEALDALRGLEEAAGRAGIAASITEAMADALPVCRAGAREMLESHVTPLR